MSAPFDFLKFEFPEIFRAAEPAVSSALGDPRASCVHARRTLEIAVHWLFRHDADFGVPYEETLAAMLRERGFERKTPEGVRLAANLVRELGNRAAHGRREVPMLDSVAALRALHVCLRWVVLTYGKPSATIPDFDEKTLPAPATLLEKLSQKKAEELSAQLDEADKARGEAERKAADFEAKLKELQAFYADRRDTAKPLPASENFNEAQTRTHLIDLLLRDAGWEPGAGLEVEVEVRGMPTTTGLGFCDYVLRGRDGAALAVVEAKRTSRDATEGEHQAKLYADCLTKNLPQESRPVIYTTNGYETRFWDDQSGPPRRIHGFHTRDELELIRQRRTSAKRTASLSVDKAIADRPYQEQAIRAVCERVEHGHRKALAVMATGSGKTRTAAALISLLMKSNRVKRVLFLADRRALAKQAHKAFVKHLPDLPCVNLLDEKDNDSARVFVCTHPTMLNMLERMDGDTRHFGPGFFDLVIIDEAHRSVYQKYRALFEYFDGFLLGLTATPKAELDKNTYGLFDLQSGVPTFAYDLEEACDQGYLVRPEPYEVPLGFPTRGIRYDELSPEDQAHWDELEVAGQLESEDGVVDAEAVNAWLFNKDTVDKALAHLMTHGFRVDGGDRLAKTIIFARNHKHAVFIVERFNSEFPQYRGEFARVIDNLTEHAEDLLDKFSEAKSAPHIAVSVDMLDTGVDVPEVANLVFFKPVRSKVKFWQMIGRGTRLCPELYGPGNDKSGFKIFDFCSNFTWFSMNPNGKESPLQRSLGEALFLAQAKVLTLINASRATPDAVGEEDDALAVTLGDTLHGGLATLKPDSVLLRPHRRVFDKFIERARWTGFNDADYSEVQPLAPFPAPPKQDDETARRFDLLIARMQAALLENDTKGFERGRNMVKTISRALLEKSSIPSVAKQGPLLRNLGEPEWWAEVTPGRLEAVRVALRDLLQVLDKEGRRAIVTEFDDTIGEARAVAFGGVTPGFDRSRYDRKMRQYLKAHENHLVLHKLRFNEPLTPTDLTELERMLFESGELGTRAEFISVYGEQPQLGVFIRSLLGLDKVAAEAVFARYLNGTTFRPTQLDFIRLIVSRLTQAGSVPPGALYEPPFTDIHSGGLDGLFPDHDANNIITLLRGVEASAQAH